MSEVRKDGLLDGEKIIDGVLHYAFLAGWVPYPEKHLAKSLINTRKAFYRERKRADNERNRADDLAEGWAAD